MNIIEIVTMILGAFGGVGGVLSIYTAKSKKNTIDIDNLQKILGDAQSDRTSLRNEMLELRNEMEGLRVINSNQLTAINTAYRCTLPAKIEDCPVLHQFEECKQCRAKEEKL